MLKDNQDAFGHCFKDYLAGKADTYIIERDDGFIYANPIKLYLSSYRDWLPLNRKAMRYIKGRVLDIGCGAGRHSLYLQEKGYDVVGIDNSPLAIKVCKERGLRDARLISTTQINSSLGIFDTVMMLGGNFGLAGSFDGARHLLERLNRVTSRNGRILANSHDPYQTDDPDYLDYQARNRIKGRMPGQIRMRIRLRRFATPWFDWLRVSREEMEQILHGTGWVVKMYVGTDTPTYVAIIEKV